MRHRDGLVAVAACAAALAALPAAGKEVGYPAAHPLVVLRVPDDWAVSETSLGLELQAPRKDSLVLAGAVVRDRASIDKWSQRALDRMRQAGVSFAGTGSAVPAAGAQGAMPDGATSSPGGADLSTYAFNGAPSVDSPAVAAEERTAAMVGASAVEPDLPTISTVDPRATTTGAPRALGHYAYEGGKLDGQPVDIELAVFPLDGKRRFLIEQESGATDARGVIIVRSLRTVAGAGR